MPRKKRVKRAARRSVARRISKGVKHTATHVKQGVVRLSRTRVVVKNLILFGVLFLISIVVALISDNKFVDQLFYILAILTAFVAVALLIALLVIIFIKQMRK